jgi:Leucine-rich repeat (LRR) protein
MGIIRGGDAEYNEDGPTFEEKTVKLEETIGACLKEDPSVLKLTGKYLAMDEVQIISRSVQVKTVKILDLSDNQINDEGLKTLFESENLAGLEELHLGVNYITDQGLLDIAGATALALKNLRVLVLSDNKLTDASVSEFVKSPNFQKLEHLDVGWNEIGNGTVKAFGETGQMASLKKLELERGYIDGEGINEFIKGSVIERLEELNLSANKLRDDDIKVLASTPKLSALRVLRLSQNLIGDEGARSIAESSTLTNLTHLYIGRNAFGNVGAQAITETKTLTNLKVLMLREGVETTPDLVNYSRPELLRPEDP